STYTCTYIKDGGTPVTVTSNPTVYFGANGTLVAKVSDGVSTVTASTYSVVRNDLYVSSAGNDTTGYGTINKPYATIPKAYGSANTTANIKVMNDLNISSPINFNANKTITLTSYSTTGAINSIKKSVAMKSYLLTVTTGTLNLNNITFDGGNITDTNGGILLYNNSNLNLKSGSTIKNFISTDLCGGGIRGGGDSITTLDGGIVTGNTAFCGGGIHPDHLVMNSGEISKNKANNGGGIYGVNDFTMNGGTISNNTAPEAGGGLYYANGTVKLNGGTIENNTATHYGGGLYIESSTLNLDGGTVKGNTSEYGGGVHFNVLNSTLEPTYFNIGNGTINGNYSTLNRTNNIGSEHNEDYNYYEPVYFTEKGNGFSYNENGKYTLVSALNGTFAACIYGADTSDGANVKGYNNTTTDDAIWLPYISRITNGQAQYYFESRLRENRLLRIEGGSSSPGSNVLAESLGNGAGYSWTMESAGNGYYYLKNTTGLCLDVYGATADNGTNIWAYTCNKSDAQKWKFKAV
ncbi:MAG: RICIN domain-containing protein, partial [Bacilli bacterium]